jgi:hypothetical protein
MRRKQRKKKNQRTIELFNLEKPFKYLIRDGSKQPSWDWSTHQAGDNVPAQSRQVSDASHFPGLYLILG